MSAGELGPALSLGAAAFVVGLSGAMSPGPYLTVTIARTVQRGWLSAGLMLVGHALLEATLLVGFAFGLQRFLQLPPVTTAMALAGGAVLLWMGYGLLTTSWTGEIARDLEVAEHTGEQPVTSHVGSIAHGAIVSLSNPYWTLWWATIGIKLASDGLAIGPVGVAAFFLGHQLADWSWYALVIAAASRGKELLTPVLYRSIMGTLALFLIYIGVRFAASGVGVEIPWLPF